jgi:hypothetical protein
MARPRCLVILPPQGGRRDFRFGELHDWPTGSSRTYDPRLARGCRCNVSRLVTYSVSSAGTGSTRCVVSMGISTDAPLDSACRLFWPIEPGCMTYAPSHVNGSAASFTPRCCLICLTSSFLRLPKVCCTAPHAPCRRSSAGTLSLLSHYTTEFLWLADRLSITIHSVTFVTLSLGHLLASIFSAFPKISTSTLASL